MAVKWYGDTVFGAIKKAAMVGVIDGTESVKETMIRYIMEPPKTGRLYKRGKDRIHQASAAGEKPANDTGNLVRNITTAYDPEKLAGNVNVGAEYGRRLEYGFVGTDSAGRTYDMAPRPYARPALAERSKDIAEGIRKSIGKALS